MTELDIEREYQEYIQQKLKSAIVASLHGTEFDGWLAAKRAVLGSAEQEKPNFVYLGNGKFERSFAPPAPVSAEPDWTGSKTLESSCWKNPLYPMGERLQMADGAVRFRDDVISNLRQQLASASPSTDEKDSERLDWLGTWCVGRCANVDMIAAVGKKFNGFDTLREAIDAAIAAKEARK